MVNGLIHIVVASDDRYAEQTAVLLASLAAHDRNSVTLHLLSNDITPENLQRLEQQAAEGGHVLQVYDISNLRDMLGCEVPDTIAMSSYARLFMASILPQDIDKVIYLDCDMVTNDTLLTLWITDIQDFWIAGVLDALPDAESKRKVGLPDDEPYFNAGMMLVNIRAWRENNVQKRFIDFLLAHNGKVHHHDQGIINAVCKDHKIILHPKYNLTSTYLSHPYDAMKASNTPFYSEQEVREAKENPCIVHFTEGLYTRPWVQGSRHPYVALYQKYHSQTAWKDTVLQTDNRSWLVKLQCFVFFRCSYQSYALLNKFLRKCQNR